MKKLIVFSLVAALCLGLNGCNIASGVSHFFAEAEDFVFMRDEAKAAVDAGGGGGGGGGDTIDPGPHALTVFASGRQVTKMRVLSWDTDDHGFRLVDETLPPIKGLTQFSELTDLENGSYTLKFTTGQPKTDDTPANLKDFTVDFEIKGSSLTLMMLVNNNDTDGPTVRVVQLPAKILEGVLVPEEE